MFQATVYNNTDHNLHQQYFTTSQQWMPSSGDKAERQSSVGY